jgi:FemAB-related protein (PEP-CTERM system-associated)
MPSEECEVSSEGQITASSVSHRQEPPDGWDEYVTNHPQASIYHASRWGALILNSFNHKTFFLAVETPKGLSGVLPLVFMKSKIFGKNLVSMPYFNYGGLLADENSAAEQLIAASLTLKKELRADYIELRQISQVPGGWPAKSHKVIMLLALPPDPDTLWQSFKTKLRTRVRRAEKEGFTVHSGQQDLLNDFYEVFAENMRDLGTPVYPRQFFHAILDKFPENSHIVVVRSGNQSIAAGFLISHRNKMEVPWASSLRRFNHLSPNMLLYWNMLKHSITKGFQVFDFGRSTRDSGTFSFKEQWGAVPHETFWVYPGKAADQLPDHSPQNPKYKWATRVWTKLPLSVANRCGPWIVGNIP